MRKELLNKANLAWLLLSVVSFIVLTILMKVGIIGSYYSITLYNIFINIILAVSLNLVIGVCGQFSLGHAGFMCIGAYCAGIMVKMMPNMTGLAIGVLIGFALSTIVALIVSIPTLRLKGDYLAIATLGFAEIVRILVQNMEITNGAAGLNGIPKLTTFPLLFVCAVIAILVVCNFTHSAPGRACLSIREDEIASEAMGINTTKYKVIAFVIGAAGLLGSFLFSKFYDKYRHGFLRTVMISLAVELLLLLPAAGQPGFIMALCALWGITVLVFNVSFQSETIRCTDEQSSSVAMSIFSGIFNFGIGAGSFLGGIVCDKGQISHIGFVGAAFAVISVLFFLVCMSKNLVENK